MKKKDKKDSIRFWNEHAEVWQEKAYDKKGEYLNFPVSQQRQDITAQKIEEMADNKNVSIIDFGCADGELVRALLKKGFINAKGMDNSTKMIETAKKMLKEEMPDIEPDKIFFVGDADNFDKREKFDFVVAMGLIEYLIDIDKFFQNLKSILKPGGFALVESRNKFFNLFSANELTFQSSLSELAEELKDAKRFSPVVSEQETEKAIKNAFISVAKNLEKPAKKSERNEMKIFNKFPFQLPQFTPKEIESFSQKQGLKLEHVIYYHFHPFLPKFENEFPVIFNKIALQMQPLGYTILGATVCSSFIALIKKYENNK